MTATHYRWDDLPAELLNPQLRRRLISTERMMIAHVYLEQGCVVPRHEHENEQLTYILEGTLRFWLGEDQSETANPTPSAIASATSALTAPWRSNSDGGTPSNSCFAALE